MRSVRYLLFCAVAVLLAACVPMLEEPSRAPSGLALTLVCNDAVRTKAETTAPGVRSYRENLISWVDFFFFPGLPDETSKFKLHYRMSSGEQDSAFFQMNLSAASIEQLFPTNGPGKDKMTALAVVNYPGDAIPIPSDSSLAKLEALAVSADFVGPSDHRQPRFMMRGVKVLELLGRDEDLVCKDTVRLERYASKMSVSVRVKDTVHLAVHEGLNDVSVSEVWHPMLDGMVIYLENGVNTVRLGGRDSIPSEMTYFSYYDNWMRFVSKDRQGRYSPIIGKDAEGYYDTYPMYMYPQRWEDGSDSAPLKEPDLKLIIPWYREEYHDETNDIHIPSTQKQCYYKVVMPGNFGKEFRSNCWYYLGLDVQILGALTDETPVTITGSSRVVYWQDKEMVVRQAEVGAARYLSVERESWSIFNQNELDIPYLSSHSLTLDSITVTRPYYGFAEAGTHTLGGVVIDSTAGTKYLKYDESYYGNWLHDTGTEIEFRHTLNNNYKDVLFDYSPYTITFRIRHVDDEMYSQEVKIIQYPAIYISRVRNSDPDSAANHTREQDYDRAWSKYNGFVIVDGAWKYSKEDDACRFIPGSETFPKGQQKRDALQDSVQAKLSNNEKKEYQWRSVHYTGGSIDMYNIHISVLPTDFNFVIGDPRVTEIDNLGYHYTPGNGDTHLTAPREWSTAPAMYGIPQRQLAYYYPTEASERTRNMLAPSYRVCSKFGGIEFGDISLEYARYRCAAYQEDGFPAGRWRVPTEAEVSFIAQLSANGAFDVLFNVGGRYWSANGAVLVNANGVTPVSNNSALLRCVYDTWYWGEDQSEYEAWRKRYDPVQPGEFPHGVFVWGDRPR